MNHSSSSENIRAQLVVLAKAPVPGRVKTRLTPPFTPQEAALLAEAALVDTLEAGASASFARHTLALDDQRAAPGTLRAELPARFEVSPQRGRGLDERIAEHDVPYLPRTGASKVTGTWRGTWQAVRDMSRVLGEAPGEAPAVGRGAR